MVQQTNPQTPSNPVETQPTPAPMASNPAMPAAQVQAQQTAGKSTSGMAITSLVLGILALLTSFLPIINNGSFFLALLGIVFAIIGLVGISKGKKSGKGVAIGGLVLGILSVAIVLITQSIFAAALDGIGESSSTSSSGTSSSAESEQTEVREAGQESPAPEEQTASSNYAVTIDEAYVDTDYEGKRVIVVTYSWVNNSDKAASAYVTLSEKAFQNGVELEHAYFVDSADSSGWDSEVKPGAGTTYQRAYVLVDDSDVTIEVTELVSWNNAVLAEAAFSVQ